MYMYIYIYPQPQPQPQPKPKPKPKPKPRLHWLCAGAQATERDLLQSILDDYIFYVESSKQTRLTRIYGLYEVKFTMARSYRNARNSVAFIIMQNVMYNPMDIPIHHVYDLKGSYVDRRAVVNKGLGFARQFKGKTLKDMDLRRPLRVGKVMSELVAQLSQDVLFLSRLQIMDYSLLIGIHDCETGTVDYERHFVTGGVQSGAASPLPGGNHPTDASPGTGSTFTPGIYGLGDPSMDDTGDVRRHGLACNPPLPSPDRLIYVGGLDSPPAPISLSIFVCLSPSPTKTSRGKKGGGSGGQAARRVLLPTLIVARLHGGRSPPSVYLVPHHVDSGAAIISSGPVGLFCRNCGSASGVVEFEAHRGLCQVDHPAQGPHRDLGNRARGVRPAADRLHGRLVQRPLTTIDHSHPMMVLWQPDHRGSGSGGSFGVLK